MQCMVRRCGGNARKAGSFAGFPLYYCPKHEYILDKLCTIAKMHTLKQKSTAKHIFSGDQIIEDNYINFRMSFVTRAAIPVIRR